jgi:GNAT superfamily N-acetyltransferase
MDTIQTPSVSTTTATVVRGSAPVIEQVSNKHQMKLFIDFPHDLYSNDPLYVPELFIAQRDLLTPGKHPFHEHSQIQLFLAFRDNKVVGRIAAINNRNHNAFNGTNDGFFGFFECIPDVTVSDALFNTAAEWLKKQGLSTIIGPVNFSTNETCGLLVEGFDSAPVLMMPYNRPYYIELIKAAEMKDNVTLIAWQVTADAVEDKPLRMMQLLENRLAQRNIVVRKINLKKFDEEVVKIREVYNKAWDKNLGFVPMTDNEFAYLAKDLKMILDPDFCIVAEKDGQAIGFALCVPDLNQVLIKIRKGRLLPTGIFKLLLGKSKIKGVRVLALGVLEPFRKLGVEAVFYGQIIRDCRKKGINVAEASWILEHNDLMNSAIQAVNGVPYKRYRIYEKAI